MCRQASVASYISQVKNNKIQPTYSEDRILEIWLSYATFQPGDAATMATDANLIMSCELTKIILILYSKELPSHLSELLMISIYKVASIIG